MAKSPFVSHTPVLNIPPSSSLYTILYITHLIRHSHLFTFSFSIPITSSDTKNYVTASACRSLNTLTEVEEPAGMGKSLGTGAHRHRSILPPGCEIRPEAVDASTNTVQPVIVFEC